MAGIFCATAQEDVVPRAMRGLALVEHLGCDSAGLGVLVDRRIQRRRVEGALAALRQLLSDEPLAASTVIGHTRKATLGRPSRRNAHPHASARVAVVHSGIIENHRELRAELEREGAQFRSETDSEAVVWLIERQLTQRVHPMRALQRVLPRLEGTYALAAIFAQHEDRVYAARRGVPLYAGRADGSAWLASTEEAIANFAEETVAIEDGQIAELLPGQVRIYDGELKPHAPRWPRQIGPRPTSGTQLLASVTDEHILAQPRVVGELLARLREDLGNGRAETWCGPLSRADRVLAVGGGPSYPLACIARSWFEDLAGIPVETELVSEVEARRAHRGGRTVALVIPHAVNDEESYEAIRHLKRHGIPTVALASASSELGREADRVLHAPLPSIVPSAESPLAVQLASLAAAAVAARSVRSGRIDEDGPGRSIFSVPQAMETALALGDSCVSAGRDIANFGHAMYLGRGLSHPVACLGAHQLRLHAHVAADGFAGGELRYRLPEGSGRPTPAVVLAPSDGMRDKTLRDARTLIQRGSKAVVVSDSESPDESAAGGVEWFKVDRVDPVWSPLSFSVPLQLLAFHVARARKWIAERVFLGEKLATAE
ncbi:MAG: SIS domain-containing protein [Myxococcota bacterium]